MKIRIKSMVFTQKGVFNPGDELTDNDFSKEFMLHLVNEANAADMLEYETKIEQITETKVKPRKKKKKATKKRTSS